MQNVNNYFIWGVGEKNPKNPEPPPQKTKKKTSQYIARYIQSIFFFGMMHHELALIIQFHFLGVDIGALRYDLYLRPRVTFFNQSL